METELSYKYKDGFHIDIKKGKIVFDKSIFKHYAERYEVTFKDSVVTSLSRRLWNCKLVWEGNSDCQIFLNNLKDFWTESNRGFSEQYDEKFKKLHEWLIKQDLVEIKFECC